MVDTPKNKNKKKKNNKKAKKKVPVKVERMDVVASSSFEEPKSDPRGECLSTEKYLLKIFSNLSQRELRESVRLVNELWYEVSRSPQLGLKRLYADLYSDSLYRLVNLYESSLQDVIIRRNRAESIGILTNCPNLKTLKIKEIYGDNIRGLTDVIKCCPNLRELDIVDSFNNASYEEWSDIMYEINQSSIDKIRVKHPCQNLLLATALLIQLKSVEFYSPAFTAEVMGLVIIENMDTLERIKVTHNETKLNYKLMRTIADCSVLQKLILPANQMIFWNDHFVSFIKGHRFLGKRKVIMDGSDIEEISPHLLSLVSSGVVTSVRLNLNSRQINEETIAHLAKFATSFNNITRLTITGAGYGINYFSDLAEKCNLLRKLTLRHIHPYVVHYFAEQVVRILNACVFLHKLKIVLPYYQCNIASFGHTLQSLKLPKCVVYQADRVIIVERYVPPPQSLVEDGADEGLIDCVEGPVCSCEAQIKEE